MKEIVKIATVCACILMLATQLTSANQMLSEQLKFMVSEDGFAISGTPKTEGLILPSDRLNMFVYSPNAEIENISEVNFQNNVVFVSSVSNLKYDTEFNLPFKASDNLPYGLYNIKVTKTTKDREAFTVFYKYYHASAETEAECFEEYYNADSEHLVSVIEYYNATLPLIQVDTIAKMPSEITNSFANLFTIVREGMFEQFLSLKDIYNCLYTTVLLNDITIKQDVQAQETYKIYGYLLNDYIDEEIDFNKWLHIYRNLKNKITNGNTLLNVLEKSLPLSFIQDSTNSQAAAAIEKYGEILGCDLSYAKQKNVQIVQVAQQLDKSNASKYYDDFGTTFKEIVDRIAQDSDSQYNSSPVSGSKSGGGKTYPSTQNVEINPVANQEDKSNEVFFDLDNVLWAKQQILELYNKNIVKGAGNGAFEPERNVTREEFTKMLVDSLQLKMSEDLKVPFDDCIEGSWYLPYIRIAYSLNVVNGISQNQFGVGRNVTRQDMTVMILNALLAMGKTIVDDGNILYSDKNQISGYALKSVTVMSKIKILNGFDDNTFRPAEYTTRAEAAVVISRLLKYCS